MVWLFVFLSDMIFNRIVFEQLVCIVSGLFEVLLVLSLFRYCDALDDGVGAELGPTDEDAMKRRRRRSWLTRRGGLGVRQQCSMATLISSDMVVVCFCVFDDDWGLGWGAGGLVAGELGGAE